MVTDNTNNAITITNVTKTFASNQRKYTNILEYLSDPRSLFTQVRRTVLDDISLEIKQGEVVGIIGNNGSGKSTLLKIMSGIYKPEKGKVKVNGLLVPLLELGVGFHPELTARENVFLNGVILGMSRDYINQNFERIIEFAELQDFLDLPLKNFSTGMQVRLAFSIAFNVDADIYLLDEVFAVGDLSFQEKSMKVLEGLRNSGKTIILVSHNLEMMQKFCSRLVLIYDGKVKQVGDPQNVVATYKLLEQQA